MLLSQTLGQVAAIPIVSRALGAKLMSKLLTLALAAAAILFIALSATMNALFLSSLGRTPLETGLLGLISVASDLAKAVLPVVIVRAILLRAWTQLTAAALMLALVVTLSLASGTGFAALTRGNSIAQRQAQSEGVAAAKRELLEVESRLQQLPHSRPISVVDADLATAMIDRRWTASKSCAEVFGPAARTYCTGIAILKAERTASIERENLARDRSGIRDKIEHFGATDNSDSDPQSAVVALLLGVDAATPRLALTAFTATVIELGSVLLILIVTGPTLLGWREPGSAPKPSPPPVTIPASKDVAHWHRRREAASITHKRGMDHA
jgi:hypothetical protein